MKKFIISVLCAAVFFIGLGSLIQETGARFKSDERALALVKLARTAIGGEENLKSVRSLTIKGAMAKSFAVEGASEIEQIELEMNLQLPNQFAKTLKHNRGDGSTEDKTVEVRTQRNLIFKSIDGGNETFKVKRNEADAITHAGEAGDAAKSIKIYRDLKMGGGMNVRQNELFRTTLALLLTAPQSIDTAFNYLGEADVDGNKCDIVEAVGGDLSVKLFLDKSSHLPRMMSYQGFKPLVFKFNKNDKNEAAIIEKLSVDKLETAEFQVKFSDYRTVNGVLLPFRWTQTINGTADENVDVANYEINPANIAEKFQNLPARVLIRTEKKSQ